MGFIGNLITSPGFFGFLGSGRPGSAALRGSLVGLASGLEAVTEEDATGKTTIKQQPLRAAFTVFAYFVEGISAALIFSGESVDCANGLKLGPQARKDLDLGVAQCNLAM